MGARRLLLNASMRLPRRVPWSSISEVEELCGWIYGDEADIDAKIRAINRLSAWRAITALPHALDSALALLSVLVQDAQPANSYLALRHGYSAAIIRLVNGLVDPLQQGMYARSIASIANQLGLPPWLVELRHAATHEDLPSLELLRQAARESMAWLLQNYFLATINPSTALAPQPPPLRPLAPVLKEYKTLSKLVTRDASLKVHQQQVRTVLRDIERWIAEASVAANVATGSLAWSDAEAKEQWALERFCEALLDKGALVPLSKKKRVFPKDAFLPPPAAVAIWTPLLTELSETHSDFASVLVNGIIAQLTTQLAEEEIVSVSVDDTYDACLARWAFWMLEKLSPDREAKKTALVALVTSLGPTGKDISSAKSLIDALCVGNAELEDALSTLVRPTHVAASEWTLDDIGVMQDRLTALAAVSEPQAELDLEPASEPRWSKADNCATLEVAPGWRLLGGDSQWRPCPIGVYVAGYQPLSCLLHAMDVVEQIIHNPAYQPYLAILKGARNGFVYGVKVRFPHALVMSILFGRGERVFLCSLRWAVLTLTDSWKSRIRVIFRATKQHATNLAKFVTLYKTFMLIQQKANGGKPRSSDTFLAGLLGGYLVFGERTAVNEQIVLYVVSRVLASFIPRSGSPYSSAPPAPGAGVKPLPPDSRYFTVFAAVAWGAVMWLFEHKGEAIQPGMFNSMVYLYRDSDRWSGLKTLLWHNT
ncbi:hypothetical protein MKEN_00784000 [Mycena kentingensis (nom. inval.)]|nr:hypothetical protein MKEN_00784000 [Mycena kentingensis (nom. inval.)]